LAARLAATSWTALRVATEDLVAGERFDVRDVYEGLESLAARLASNDSVRVLLSLAANVVRGAAPDRVSGFDARVTCTKIQCDPGAPLAAATVVRLGLD